MTLVAGIDSSTQSCKVVIRDAATGDLVRQGRATHPDGTEVDPAAWWSALRSAITEAGGLDDVAAASVGAQQHGMVCLDADGAVVRPALLWNDTRSAGAADDLVRELGARAWADAVGVVPVASFTITKLRWLATHEPASVAATAAVCLPHDWLTWKLAGAPGLDALRTDRSDASGTGYWSAAANDYRLDLLAHALGRTVHVPTVLGPTGSAGTLADGAAVLGPGAGDNAAAGLGVGAGVGDVVVSIGTSGTVFSVATGPSADPTGIVAGFASADGAFLPLVCTLNASRVLDVANQLLGVDFATLDGLALSTRSEGLTFVPYLTGERTPNRPDATGALHGLTLTNTTPGHLARATVEGLLCSLADCLDALLATGARCDRVILVGGGAQSLAVRRLAPAIFGLPVVVPPAGEYVADGAARQAAWLATGSRPEWELSGTETFEADPTPEVRERYAEARDLTLRQLP